LKRVAPIDILRIVAILLVLGRYMGEAGAHSYILAALRRCGWVDVDLFFVLSGFLISGLLFKGYKKSGRINVLTVLLRRGFKIYPPFYVFILITMLVETPHRPNMLAEIFFVQNYLPGVRPHTRSLAVEEHFYLLLPLLFLVLCNLARNSSDPFKSLPAAPVPSSGCALVYTSICNRLYGGSASAKCPDPNATALRLPAVRGPTLLLPPLRPGKI
jgi:peptidoglycan/LPS O-acetylase OafA/YrhL